MKLNTSSGQLPARLLRRITWAAAALCLSGCAALQIDVDVYKGPLVHDEDTQVQQLASIAMSAKAVMLIQRNKWLDAERPGWRIRAASLARHDPAASMLTRFIRSGEWQDLNVCGQAQGEGNCRRARLINDILSTYENKADPAITEAMDRLRGMHDRYARTYAEYQSARKSPTAKREDIASLKHSAERTQRDLLAETARVLKDSKDSHLQTLGNLAMSLQFNLIAGPASLDSTDTELDAIFRELQSTTASGFDNGRPHLGLDHLANTAADQRSEDRKARRDRDAQSSTDELERLADNPATKRLQDSVVDLASRMQFLAVNLGLVDETNPSTSKANPFDTLGAAFAVTGEQSQAQQDARAFKATLEVIANSLLVLAEDQRRQRFQRADQQAFANHEYQSAVQAFQIDPARRFDHLVEHYRTRKTAAAGTEAAQLAKLEKTAKEAIAAQTAASVQTQLLSDAVWGPRQLLLTLVRELPAGVTAIFKADPADAAENWAADSTKLRAALAAAPAKTTMADVLKLAQAWLEQQANAAQTKGGPHLQRLVAAQKAIRGLQATATTAALARAEVIAKLDTNVVDSWTLANAAHQASQAQLTERGAELTSAETAVKDHKKAKHPSHHIQAALAAVLAARASVLAQATMGKGAHEVDTMAGLVKAELQKLPAEPAGLKTEAINQLDQWAATAPRALKLPERTDGSRNSALNTLDRIEAFLSYTRVDALNRGSTAGAEQATAALDALMARRERMSYLRPASTYLRSALATTSQQTDPALEWSNLLAATVKRLSGEYDISKQRERDVRGELDKSFWQNVNKVRVSAGGDSNFAIAKDDVGNWYVKAMGADLGPMIKAAKNLALYNLGGRVDTNLLRIDELRNKTGRVVGDADDTELNRLVDRQTGAATSAYGNTLKVFADNHTTAVSGLLEEVDTHLKVNGLAAELGRRWDSTYATEEGQRAALPSLNTNGGEALAALHTQALAATADGLAKTAGTTPSAQLLKALGLLAQQRTLLRDQVNGTALLLSAALEGDQKGRSEVETLAKAQARAQTNRAGPTKELTTLQSQFDGATGEANAARRADLAPKLAAQQKVVNEMGNQIADLHNQLMAAQELARQAAATLAAARDRQARALADVDAVWARHVKDVASRHLRAVEEMETAARVVSQGVQGKPSKP